MDEYDVNVVVKAMVSKMVQKRDESAGGFRRAQTIKNSNVSFYFSCHRFDHFLHRFPPKR